jgi:regulatory protein
MRIKSFLPIPRKSDRYDIVLDGDVSAGVLGSADIAELGLHVGDMLDEKLLAVVAERSAEISTMDRALRMLAARDRSTVDLRRRLIRAGEPAAHVDRALERLAQSGVLNDERYAASAARQKIQGRGLSKRRFKREMHASGLPREAADAAVERLEEEGGIDERAAAERLVAKKLRSMRSLDAATRKRRLFGLLARRGYDSEVIRSVLSAIEDEPGEDSF